MKIGEWDLQSVVAGKFRLDGGAMFGVVPKAMWNKVAPADEHNRIAMVMRLLVIRGHGKTAIVDVGCGQGYGDKLSRIYAFEHNDPMEESLASLGLAIDDVTDVILTHLHFDHGGGVAYPDGDTWRLTFPNARHHLQKAQWDHARRPTPRDRASYFPERIDIMEREGVLDLYDGDWTLAPGIDVIAYHGHTPGQQLPRISAGGQTVFHCGDLVPLAPHIPIPYVMSYDLQPVVTMAEKTLMLKAAADEGWMLFFEHDPAVEACTVSEANGRFSVAQTLQFQSS
jgi:glyoxylase-like metal-dependent hydrolase (beta-lactamase superfamily II)